jgi:uncharacterized protein (TIGR04255 family)
MSNAPVYYALAQLRFNTIAALNDYIPTLQDKLRKQGFPDFSQAVTTSVNMQVTPGQQLMVPAVQSSSKYLFLNAEKTAGFVLDQSSISFQTTDYDTSEKFKANLLKGLEILHNAVQLSYSERLGLRYLDAVWPKEGETLSEYLAPSMLGLFEHLEDRELVHSVSETRAQNGSIVLVGRSTILNQPNDSGAAFPFELQPVPLQLTEKFREIRGVYVVLDTDSWVEGRESFDLKKVSDTLSLLQVETRFSFDQMVTPHALKVWN